MDNGDAFKMKKFKNVPARTDTFNTRPVTASNKAPVSAAK